jgi:hypothetical protein
MNEIASLTSYSTEPHLFRGFGILVDVEDQDFLKIVETLSRIGLPSGDQTKLVQSCHILHKRGQYAIMHFLELFLFDGKTANFSETDRHRRNTIARLLQEWGLLKIKNTEELDGFLPLKKIKIVPFKEKSNWQLISKYQVGGKKQSVVER